jgi:hypothetical protein
MSGSRASILVLVTICLIGLGGCSHSQRAGADRVVHIALSEYRLNPKNVSVSAGLVTIYVRNYGRLTHDLVISLNGQPEISSKPIAPGQTAVLDAALIPGRYQLASSILSDQALGAYGTLDVGS